MNLIAILIAAATERYWKSFGAMRPFQWLVSFACWLHQRWGAAAWFNGPRGVLLAIAPGVVAIALLQYALATGSGFIVWLVTLAFSVLVLILCIGNRGADEQIDEYLHALEREDAEGAYLHVREILQGREAADPAEVNRLVIETLLVRNHERLLAILFWFVILGPVGAMLYRSTAQLKGVMHSGRTFDADFIEAVLRLQALLDWVPARITALCYGIIGSFVDAVRQWRTAGPEWSTDIATTNRGVLVNSGLGSLRISEPAEGEEPQVDLEALRATIAQTRALIQRTVIAWITMFAILTIVGWLS
jgi:AmpE protein